jgi:hypothetical protein
MMRAFRKEFGMRAFLLFTIMFSYSAEAASTSFDRGGFHITVAPIIGYELTAVNSPTPHTRGMLIYGARVTAGQKLISGEGEYTLGTTDESFVLQGENLKTSKQNARLGLRSAIELTHWMDFIFRGGGQASKTKVDTTTISSGTTTTSAPDWEIHPYAGAGIQASFAEAFSLGLEATYLFRSVSDWSQNDVQTTFSIKIHLASK